MQKSKLTNLKIHPVTTEPTGVNPVESPTGELYGVKPWRKLSYVLRNVLMVTTGLRPW